MSRSIQKEFLAAAWAMVSIVGAGFGYWAISALAGISCGLAVYCAIKYGWQEEKTKRLKELG